MGKPVTPQGKAAVAEIEQMTGIQPGTPEADELESEAAEIESEEAGEGLDDAD